MSSKENPRIRLERNEDGKLQVVGKRLENTKAFAAAFLPFIEEIGNILTNEYPDDNRVAMKLLQIMQLDGDYTIGEAAAAALSDPDAKRAEMPRAMQETLGKGILWYESFGPENDLRLLVRKLLLLKQGGGAARKNVEQLVGNAKKIIDEMKESGTHADVDIVWTNARLANLNLLFADGQFTPEEMRQLFDRAEWGFDHLLQTQLWHSVLSKVPGMGARIRFPGKKKMQHIVKGTLKKMTSSYDIAKVRELMQDNDPRQTDIPFLLLLAEGLRGKLSEHAKKNLPLHHRDVIEHTTGNILQTLFAATETSFAEIKRMMIKLQDPKLFAQLKAEALAALPNGLASITPETLMRGDLFPKLVAEIHDSFRNPPTPLDQRVNVDPETGEESTTYIGLQAMTENAYRQQVYTTFSQLVRGEWFANVNKLSTPDKKYSNPRDCPGATWAITEIMCTILAILLETNGVRLANKPVEFKGVTSTPRNVNVQFIS
ncbi:MAG: hypothetical protein ABI425_01780 [Patescibacteria group bacterium]